jgi:hypothetical protein
MSSSHCAQGTGMLLYLKNGPVGSPRRWQVYNYLKNSFVVVYLTLIFLVARSGGLLRNNAAWFYGFYYEKKTR